MAPHCLSAPVTRGQPGGVQGGCAGHAGASSPFPCLSWSVFHCLGLLSSRQQVLAVGGSLRFPPNLCTVDWHRPWAVPGKEEPALGHLCCTAPTLRVLYFITSGMSVRVTRVQACSSPNLVAQCHDVPPCTQRVLKVWLQDRIWLFLTLKESLSKYFRYCGLWQASLLHVSSAATMWKWPRIGC